MGSFTEGIRSFVKRHFRKHPPQQPTREPKYYSPPLPVNSEPQDDEPAATSTSDQVKGDQPEPKPIRVHNRAAVRPSAQAATTTGTLQIALKNQANSSKVYAYITGRAIDNNNAVFMLQADAKSPYYPASPSKVGSPVPVNLAIPLGAPGNTVTATIPRLAGARIWFSIDKPLIFLLNPGPGVVEPSVFNPSDPNYNTNFSFCEFTFNSAQVFVNISYVDFVSNVPIALTLADTSGGSQHVGGMKQDGLATVAKGLRAQTAADGRRWSSLVIQSDGKDLRALSPNSGITTNPRWFETYWTDYVNQVWAKYRSQPLIVDTQASWGEVQGQVNSSGYLDFGDGSTFAKPTSADIFSSNSGPFATGGNAKTNAIIPRLCAGFNRSTLLASNQTPNGTSPSQYYQNPVTNHYSRIVHAANVDGLGYAWPYDDVSPDAGAPQEGAIFSFSPSKLTVTVGGNNAHAG